MLVLRKEARGWRLEDMGDEPPASPPLDPEFMEGVQEDEPQVGAMALCFIIMHAVQSCNDLLDRKQQTHCISTCTWRFSTAWLHDISTPTIMCEGS